MSWKRWNGLCPQDIWLPCGPWTLCDFIRTRNGGKSYNENSLQCESMSDLIWMDWKPEDAAPEQRLCGSGQGYNLIRQTPGLPSVVCLPHNTVQSVSTGVSVCMCMRACCACYFMCLCAQYAELRGSYQSQKKSRSKHRGVRESSKWLQLIKLVVASRKKEINKKPTCS